ncbi:TPA: hypothetical protein H1016_03780, partial [archaeon]|nr:hypothetical protein [Candidatus Naiadarchaeum limnaeum]
MKTSRVILFAILSFVFVLVFILGLFSLGKRDILLMEPPTINFVPPTPLDTSFQTANAIYVNVSVSDINEVYGFTNFDNSLVGWWRMDNNVSIEESATLVFDWSAKGNNGTVIGTGAVPVTPGKFGGAYRFNGINSYINAPGWGSLAFNAAGSYTWSAWIYPRSFSANVGGIMMKCNVGGQPSGYSIYIDDTGKLNIDDCFPVATSAGSTGSLTLNAWNYVAINYSNKAVTLFINGVASGTGSMSGFADDSSQPFQIGRGHDGNSYITRYFDGIIDEVLVFNRSLSAQEIAALYNASAGRFYNNYTNLELGEHTFTAYAVNSLGDKSQTEERRVTIILPCPEGEQRNCPLQDGVCLGTNETCFGGQWEGCDALYFQHSFSYNATEGTYYSCDGLDNDCDNLIDEAPKNTYYRDFDGDSFGNLTNTTQDCLLPAGFVTNSNDCDDDNNAINPAATEICDGIDNNCDMVVDPGCGNCINGETRACGTDVGECVVGIQSCENGVWNETCAGAILPSTEVCDSKDNDCDGSTDEGCGTGDGGTGGGGGGGGGGGTPSINVTCNT